jgi:hypothetical protein
MRSSKPKDINEHLEVHEHSIPSSFELALSAYSVANRTGGWLWDVQVIERCTK